jgi:hypothetical protein
MPASVDLPVKLIRSLSLYLTPSMSRPLAMCASSEVPSSPVSVHVYQSTIKRQPPTTNHQLSASRHPPSLTAASIPPSVAVLPVVISSVSVPPVFISPVPVASVLSTILPSALVPPLVASLFAPLVTFPSASVLVAIFLLPLLVSFLFSRPPLIPRLRRLSRPKSTCDGSQHGRRHVVLLALLHLTAEQPADKCASHRRCYPMLHIFGSRSSTARSFVFSVRSLWRP